MSGGSGRVAAVVPGVKPACAVRSNVVSGLVLASIIMGCAYSLREVLRAPFLSPMILAVLIGIIFRAAIGLPGVVRAGLGYAQREILRFAIILLGFQISVGQLLELGAKGVTIAVLATGSTFIFTSLLGRWLGVDRGLTCLIAAGTSVCGASAIVATQAVERAKEEDVAYSIALVTLLGTAAMVILPVLSQLLALPPGDAGIWIGASIHEVAQVVGAAFQVGPATGESGVVTKLLRILMLVPLILALAAAVRRRERHVDAPQIRYPWFVLGFLLVICLNSLISFPPVAIDATRSITSVLLTVGLAAVGLQADVSDLRSRGWLPLLLGTAASIFIIVGTLAMLKLW